MELTKLGVLGFFDTLQGKEIGPFARKIEELGYGALWVPEIMGREIFSLSTYVLSQTERLTVGTGVAIAYTYEPIAAIGAARTLSELFDNRFILGLGVSNKTYNMRRGVGYEKPVSFMRDYVAKMKAAPYNAPKPTTRAADRPRSYDAENVTARGLGNARNANLLYHYRTSSRVS